MIWHRRANTKATLAAGEAPSLSDPDTVPVKPGLPKPGEVKLMGPKVPSAAVPLGAKT